jgi:ribosomal protein L21E
MAKTHTIDGVQYREVARKVRYGDEYIVPLDDDMDITKGKAYKVTGIDSYGDPEFVDDAGDPRACLSEGEYVVLEPVTATSDLSALESELAAMKAKVAEMERQLAEAKVADRLKVGDYAKVVDADYWLLNGFKIGDIVQVTVNPFGEDDRDYRIQSIVDPDTIGYAHKERGFLRRATDEEVAEALEAKRKREEAEKWAAIGRKPGEFKVGDIVKITKYQHGHITGSYVEVVKIRGNKAIDVRGPHYRSLETFGADVDCVELVAPVESVVNLRVS